jgi:hypothetical protein
MTPQELDALDARVLRAVRSDPEAINTPTALWDRIFDYGAWTFDEVPGDLTARALRVTYARHIGVGVVRSSAERLVRAGKLMHIYGLGMNGRETLMYTTPEFR